MSIFNRSLPIFRNFKIISCLFLFFLTACSAGIERSVVSIPSERVSKEATPWQAEITRTPIPTPTINPNLVISDYDPEQWRLLFDKATVWKVDVDGEGKVWIFYGINYVGFFDDGELTSFSSEDIGISSITDMAIAPDGSVWVSGTDKIAHYISNHWNVTTIPYSDAAIKPRLAVDHNDVVWMAVTDCNCSNNVWSFDGKDWTQLISESKHNASRLLIAPDNTLWATFYSTGIGKFDGNEWVIYSVSDLWQPFEYGVEIGINSDKQGNIYGISNAEEKVVEIMQDGSVTRISYEGYGFELDPTRIRIFIDSGGVIWMNAYFNDNRYNNIEYYADDHWVVITNLPFTQMMYMLEISEGLYLIGTAQGLYEFDTTK